MVPFLMDVDLGLTGRDPAITCAPLTGTDPAAGGTGALDLTDAHTDLVAQFHHRRHEPDGVAVLRAVGCGHRHQSGSPGRVAGLPVPVHSAPSPARRANIGI